MAWTLCTSGAAILKAGVKANSTIVASAAALLQFSDMAEGKIVGDSRFDWVGSYSSADTDVKNLLADTCASFIAMDIVKYDPSSYGSVLVAQTILDVLYDGAKNNLKALANIDSNSIRSL